MKTEAPPPAMEPSLPDRLRRLERLVYLAWAWLILGSLLLFGYLGLQAINAGHQRWWESVEVSWTADGGLAFRGWDGPFVLTHLIDENVTKVATLPAALAHVESGNTVITKAQMARLIWRDRKTGEPVPRPEPGTPLRVVYLVARKVKAGALER